MIQKEEMGQGKFLIGVALLPLTAAAPPPDAPRTVILNGTCSYPAPLPPRRPTSIDTNASPR
jgi:hypothetical protein